VAVEAARLLYEREFKEYYHAKREAARRLGARHLPRNREIHQELRRLAEALGGEERPGLLREMRQVALEYMELLKDHDPRLIGSVLTGHIRPGSDIDLHVYTDDPLGFYDLLDEAGLAYEVEEVRSRKRGEVMDFVHVHLFDPRGHTIEITLYPASYAHNQPRSSLVAGPMPRATLAEVRRLLEEG
jgi:predicted nucleotidyltransferase